MENFLCRIEEGYSRHKNPYHNNLHGADVVQTVHYMLCQTGLMVIWKCDKTLNYAYCIVPVLRIQLMKIEGL